MRVFSFVRKGLDLEPIEVEVSLVPGIPTFQLIGLPDAAIKESILRIKSALRHQEFQLPRRDQVLIHLKPSHEKKTSQGLDLAIVAAYLLKTEQIEAKTLFGAAENIYFYGEVGLAGQVTLSQDIELLEELPANSVLVVGDAKNVNGQNLQLHFAHGRVQSLKDLFNIKWCEADFSHSSQNSKKNKNDFLERYKDYEFTSKVSHLLMVAATGEHNIFLAGPAGTGKTTFSESLHALLKPATPEAQRKIDKITRITKREMCGRPFVSPHHSASDIALLGGGAVPMPGEVTRAQFGMLVLDEFLEFNNYVKESLREPIEKHEITICRAGAKMTFPADFLLVGTSNLCPCGEYVPSEPAPCGQSSTRCKSYYRRLSGPLLDRFEIIAFSHKWKTREKMRLGEIKLRVEAAQKFALSSRGQIKSNGRLSLRECEDMTPLFTRQNLLPNMPASHRRLMALYRVARTLADLEESAEIKPRHIQGAKDLTIQPFTEIKAAWR